MNFWLGKIGETPRKTYSDSFSSITKPYEVTETRNRDPSGGRRVSNRLRHGATLYNRIHKKNNESWFIVNSIVIYITI